MSEGILYVTKTTLERYQRCLPEHIIPPEIKPPYFAYQYHYKGTLIIALEGSVPRYKGGGNTCMEMIEAEFEEFMSSRERSSIPHESFRHFQGGEITLTI